MAHNFHTQRTFAAKLARAVEHPDEDDWRRPRRRRGRKSLALPSAQPTKTQPHDEAPEASAARPVSGPKGIEFLGTPQGP
jgi:hypothetical protein